jgi:hypothetical protein
MFKKTDPNTFTKYSELYMKDAEGVEQKIGTVYFEYQVTLYEDVQSNGATSIVKAKDQKFILDCTQRINIYNEKGLDVSPTKNLNSYQDYPALIHTSMTLAKEDNTAFFLLDYSPQTVNTQIQTSLAEGDSEGNATSNSSSSTVGSSTSQTNTFGTSVSASYGTISGVTATASYEHSSTVSRDKSKTTGSDVSNSNSTDSSNSASMSMKDWGAYALVDPDKQCPVWTFGQEYPWDAIECRKYYEDQTNPENDNQVKLDIPAGQESRLYNGGFLYPPSELSVFGVNFVMKATWLVVIENSVSDEIDITHSIDYFQASHLYDSDLDEVSVYMDQDPVLLSGTDINALSTSVHFNFMALSPLGVLSNAAIIGFIPNKFILKPDASQKFKIISTTNDLMIQDTSGGDAYTDGGGFSVSETALTATFSETCPSLQMTVYFKVIDSMTNYTLYLKHWKLKTNGAILKMVINEDPDNPDDNIVITQYVDALEAEGGENNLLSIALRNQSFASIDYHDYLQLGLNSIKITITPISQVTSDNPCAYQLRAISIEGE